MTLPSSGPISIADIATEYGVALPCVFPTAFHGKPGIAASGPLTMPTDFYAKSSVVFTPAGGTVTVFDVALATTTLNCNLSAVWTYSGGGVGSSVSIASGASATSITFTLTGPASGLRTASWTVQGVSNGITRNFTVNLEAGPG